MHQKVYFEENKNAVHSFSDERSVCSCHLFDENMTKNKSDLNEFMWLVSFKMVRVLLFASTTVDIFQ